MMTNQPPISNFQDSIKVGVIIVNWDGFKDTYECIRSLLKQKYTNFEIIVVDNGSNDNSADHLEEVFTWLKVIRLPENIGFVGGNNYGIKEGLNRKCTYFLLLNNDTVADEGLIEEMVKVASNNPRCGIVNPIIYYYDKPNTIQSMGINYNPWVGIPRMRFRKTVDKGQRFEIINVTCATGCALLIKSEVILKIGLLDQIYFAYGEDIDWSLRAQKAGYFVLIAPSGKVWHKEDISWEKKKSQCLRLYLSTRNILWLNYSYMKWYQCFSIIPSYLVFWVGIFVILSILRNDFRAFLAILWGINGFFRMIIRIKGYEAKEKFNIVRFSGCLASLLAY
jgi:GT2 family glycosyltransferase